MKTWKMLGDISCIFLACVAVVIISFFAYYSIFNKDITIGVNNIDNQIAVDVKKAEDMSEEERNVYEERYFMVANYFDNSKNNGTKLQELRFDYFTSYKLTQADYRSTGMQYLGDFSTYTTTVKKQSEADRKVVNDFYYYDTTNGVTWSGYNDKYGSLGTTLNRNQAFVIKIDDRAFSIQLTGQYKTYGKILFWSYEKSTTFYDYGDVFDCVFKAIKSNNSGYGDYYITVDLSEFFTVKEYDAASGKFKADNVSDIIKNYCVLKFHYENNGAIASSQSLFGSIECNSKYDFSENNFDTTYWQERVVYNLTEKNLSYRYSSAYDGYFVSLNLDTKNMFKKMSRAKVNIKIDLNSQYLFDNNIKIVGFDYNAFEDFEIDTLRIVGESQTFYLLEKCLYNSQVSTLERSAGVILNFGTNSINNTYSEVIL